MWFFYFYAIGAKIDLLAYCVKHKLDKTCSKKSPVFTGLFSLFTSFTY
ncbi:hypothetical protein [uncultured Gammaproteobacteria bacterium]|nr:hypothetical protein BROOK1789B_1511 [Bathymodiolus brooksi thiotrophic gill symbiont]CAC9600595.1 hypothetical protein [uncultured Gammaproteobacteria bacterium]CAC9957360.1 hypothetical protein [uncultured Gammaproteobacteria bacterium]